MDATHIELFKHNLWANLRLLDACASLSDEALNTHDPGAFGPIRTTLVHLLAAEERYVLVLGGQPPECSLHESGGFPGFDELRERARWSGEALIEIAGRLDPTVLVSGTRRGRPYEMRAGVLLIQAIHHANEHRTNITTILNRQGIGPPDLSGWAYGRETGYFSME